MMDDKRSIIPGRLYIIVIFIIIIVIIKNQLYQEDYMSTGLKTLISVSTVFLLLLIVAYHMLEKNQPIRSTHTELADDDGGGDGCL